MYLTGGTALVTKGKITGRIIERGSDVMGRFSWIKLNGKIISRSWLYWHIEYARLEQILGLTLHICSR